MTLSFVWNRILLLRPFPKELLIEEMSFVVFAEEISINSEPPRRIVIQQVYTSICEENELVNITLAPEFKDMSRLFMGEV